MGGLTCLTCQVGFTDSELHRLHFKGDWHRYNLKRKVANLPSVTANEFEARKALHQQQEESAATTESGTYCIACRKNFSNEKAYDNHVNSKKHKEMVLKAGPDQLKAVKENAKISMQTEDDEDDVEMEEVDSDEWEDYEDEPVPVADCFFCSRSCGSLENKVKHMTEVHSFFIPDPEYLIDLQGLLEYLGAKVGQGMVCLWCSEKSKQYTSLEAVQKHMVDKGHCKMKHEGETLIEYSEFYDYSSSYPEGEDEETAQESEVKLDELDDSGFQLTLPSGATIGHRSLAKYYRQSLNPNRELVIANAKNRGGSSQLLSTYRALGWSGSSKQEVAKKVRDIKFMSRISNKKNMKQGWQNNNLMRHFHDRNEGLQ